MDRKPQRPDYTNRQNDSVQINQREADRNFGTRRGYEVPQHPQRRAVRRPPQRSRKPSRLFYAIVLAVIVVIAVALVFVFKGGEEPRSGGDGNTAYNADSQVKSFGQGDSNHKPVLLDAGHGFGDIGCSPDALNGETEKNITLKAVKLLKSKLEAKGYTVVLTHDGVDFTSASALVGKLESLGYDYKSDQIIDNNVFSAYERTMWANVLNSEKSFGAFVSLHVNSNDKTTLTGFTIDYCGANEYTTLSERLSSAIDSALKRDYPQRSCDLFRDTWEDSYIVTKYSMMPSCLVEMGYGSNPSDAAFLLDDSWLESLMSSIADGIDSYYKG